MNEETIGIILVCVVVFLVWEFIKVKIFLAMDYSLKAAILLPSIWITVLLWLAIFGGIGGIIKALFSKIANKFVHKESKAQKTDSPLSGLSDEQIHDIAVGTEIDMSGKGYGDY